MIGLPVMKHVFCSHVYSGNRTLMEDKLYLVHIFCTFFFPFCIKFVTGCDDKTVMNELVLRHYPL